MWIGLAGSLLIAGAAYWKRSLSGSGFVAAVLLGTTMYTFGSAVWFGTLIAFFLSSTLLSRWKRKRKQAAESGYEKTGRRDAGQVAANGALGLLLCTSYALWPHPSWWYAFLGVMAAVNADTWATEIGGLSRSAPRSILNGRRVAPGTSGGITVLGLGASAVGGLFIALAAWMLWLPAPEQPIPSGDGGAMPLLALWLAVGLSGGMVGSLVDSLLGATVQQMYRCSGCGREVEAVVHCGQPTVRTRGYSGWNNDVVNVAASLAGGAAALITGSILG